MPPFGFGMSMPNLRNVSAAAPAPVTLVQENWVGSGSVSGRTPSPTNSGGGTWQINASGSTSSYAAGQAFVDGTDGNSTFRHSVALTDANMTTIAGPALSGGIGQALIAYARSTPGPTADLTSYYQLYVPVGSVSLSKIVSGVETSLASAAVDAQGLSLSFSVVGSTITVKVNGAQVIQVTDTAISTAGYWGYQTNVLTDENEGTVRSNVGPITIATS